MQSDGMEDTFPDGPLKPFYVVQRAVQPDGLARWLELTLLDLDLLAFPLRDFLSAKQDHIRNQVATDCMPT